VPERSDQYILLLPERRRFAGQALSLRVGKWLARGDRLADAAAGEQAQLQRHFHVSPPSWPMAAIGRQAESGDATGACWLRADPVFLRPDINGARLMAWGNLGLDAAVAHALVDALQPTFAEAGMDLSAGAAERWYLRLPADAAPPGFVAPSEALGEDMLGHLPQGEAGKRWRALLNEAQIILHNHPLNAGRAALGLPPANSLWFWGGGALPDMVSCVADAVRSDDADLQALARIAGVLTNTGDAGEAGSRLLDLRRERDWTAIEQGPLQDARERVRHGQGSVLLDFADGARWRLQSSQAWRLWRRPLSGLEA
jgi:hypothetical protein